MYNAKYDAAGYLEVNSNVNQGQIVHLIEKIKDFVVRFYMCHYFFLNQMLQGSSIIKQKYLFHDNLQTKLKPQT